MNDREARRPRRSYVFESVVMTPKDADDLTNMLKREFAALKILSAEYWRPFFDEAAWERDSQARVEAWRKGEEPPPRRYAMPIPVGAPLPYHDSLGALSESEFIAWIEPPGWVPKWAGPHLAGNLYIDNEPESQFYFRRGKYGCRTGASDGKYSEMTVEPPVPADDRVVQLYEGRLVGGWFLDNQAACAFHRVVKRLVLGFTSIGHYRVDEVLLRPYPPAEPRRRNDRSTRYRHGPDAERWALARRGNYFAGNIFRKPSSYPYAPREFIGDDEMPERERRMRAEIAALRREMDAEAAERTRRKAAKKSKVPGSK
jgi:hypothetical protein